MMPRLESLRRRVLERNEAAADITFGVYGRDGKAVTSFLEKKPVTMTVFDFKVKLGSELKMDPNRIGLRLWKLDGEILSDPCQTLEEIGNTNKDQVKFFMKD